MMINMINKLKTLNVKKVMVLNNFVDQVAARPPSQHSDDSELYQVNYYLPIRMFFLFKTPKDVYLHVFAEPLTTSCLALLIAAAILAQAATFLHIFTPLASQPNII